MKLFGKKIPQKAKQGLVKIALLVLGICAALSMPFIASFGWFTIDSGVKATGMQITVSKDKYALIIDRPDEQFDETELNMENHLLYPNISDLKDTLEDDDYSISAVDTADSSKLAFELINEYRDVNGGYNLLPGSYGRLHFYIRPYEGYDNTTVSISLDIVGYEKIYAGEPLTLSSIEPITDSQIKDILKGHLLFFTGRTGATYNDYVYTGLIENGCLQYDMSSHDKCETVGFTDCYEITLYWEWPFTYDEIIEGISTVSPAVTGKYPAELGTYISENPEYFFATNIGSTDAVLLSDGYDDGDQLIGDFVDFIVVKIK